MTDAEFETAIIAGRGMLRGMASRYRVDMIDDLVQETCLQAWLNRGKWRGDANVTTWMVGILHNLIRNDIGARRRMYQADEVLIANSLKYCEVSSVEKDLDTGTQMARIEKLRSKLTARRQAGLQSYLDAPRRGSGRLTHPQSLAKNRCLEQLKKLLPEHDRLGELKKRVAAARSG